MVGVPRSKGCRVCVQRRVKCDQTRPFCNRCIKGNRNCPGYEPSIKFQDEGPKLREMYRRDTSEQPSVASSAPSSTEDPQFEYSTEVPLTLRLTTGRSQSSEPDEDEGAPTGRFEVVLLVAVMSPSANQAALMSRLISSITPQHSPNLVPTFQSTTAFLVEVAVQAGHSPVLEWAVRAVAMSHLGRQVRDQPLVSTSRQMYRQALLTLNAALQDPVEGLSSKTLSATVLLSFYEILNCTEKDSWVRHAGGAGHLMRLRGVERHRTGLGKACFLACRHSLAIESFASRTPSFLDLQPWRELSQEIQTASNDRDPLSDLVTDFHLLMVQLPGFVRQANLPGEDLTRTATIRQLLVQGQQHRANLKTLHQQIVKTLKGIDQEPTEHPSRLGDTTFPLVYHYSSLGVGSLLCGCWSLLSIVNRNLANLEMEIEQADTGRGRPSHESHTPTTQRYHLRKSPSDAAKYLAENIHNARQCCKSAEYLSNSAFLGPLYLTFALRVAYNTLEGEEEKAWVVRKLEDVSNNLGIARVLSDIREGDSERLWSEIVRPGKEKGVAR